MEFVRMEQKDFLHNLFKVLYECIYARVSNSICVRNVFVQYGPNDLEKYVSAHILNVICTLIYSSKTFGPYVTK